MTAYATARITQRLAVDSVVHQLELEEILTIIGLLIAAHQYQRSEVANAPIELACSAEGKFESIWFL